jgi:hypothetical protein
MIRQPIIKNLKKDFITFGFTLSNGYSRANLASSSTRQKISIFGEYSHSPKWLFWKFARLARLANIRQAILGYSPNSHSPKIKFHDTRQTRQHLANLSNVLILVIILLFLTF